MLASLEGTQMVGTNAGDKWGNKHIGPAFRGTQMLGTSLGDKGGDNAKAWDKRKQTLKPSGRKE